MSGRSRSHEDNDLDIFKGMDGFEGLADDDSILVALLDDLQENTLLTLMGDNLLQDDFQFDESNLCPPPVDSCFLIGGHGNLKVDASCRNSGRSSVSQCKRQRNEQQCEDSKRLRLNTPATNDLRLNHDAKDTTLMHIMHDHCYASTNSNSDEENSNEEGNCSDTGVYVILAVEYW